MTLPTVVPAAMPRDFLGDWRGTLVCDDYAGYKALFSNGITEPAAWRMPKEILRPANPEPEPDCR